MQLYLQQELQKFGTVTPIAYKPYITVNKKWDSKSDALKVDIKT